MQHWPNGVGCVQSPACLECLGSTIGGKPAFSYAECPDNCYPDGAVADEAVRQLGLKNKTDDSWFLAVGFKRPHLGW
jgi:hypothetical protein